MRQTNDTGISAYPNHEFPRTPASVRSPCKQVVSRCTARVLHRWWYQVQFLCRRFVVAACIADPLGMTYPNVGNTQLLRNRVGASLKLRLAPKPLPVLIPSNFPPERVSRCTGKWPSSIRLHIEIVTRNDHDSIDHY